ncbi:hypothetical protein Tcan_09177 [Toxocara canis]|uniref:C-type lectin domain-containing protein n=1 Tax=Toxocara canis TaxID=6265 RepID=A0A0B2W1C9_TOXCA|nr:hypothetical protein Tcan_09177 [Toxocara canis]
MRRVLHNRRSATGLCWRRAINCHFVLPHAVARSCDRVPRRAFPCDAKECAGQGDMLGRGDASSGAQCWCAGTEIDVSGVKHCFELGKPKQNSWTQANDDCVAKGGHLAHLSNPDTYDLLLPYLKQEMECDRRRDVKTEVELVPVDSDVVSLFGPEYENAHRDYIPPPVEVAPVPIIFTPPDEEDEIKQINPVRKATLRRLSGGRQSDDDITDCEEEIAAAKAASSFAILELTGEGEAQEEYEHKLELPLNLLQLEDEEQSATVKKEGKTNPSGMLEEKNTEEAVGGRQSDDDITDCEEEIAAAKAASSFAILELTGEGEAQEEYEHKLELPLNLLQLEDEEQSATVKKEGKTNPSGMLEEKNTEEAVGKDEPNISP